MKTLGTKGSGSKKMMATNEALEMEKKKNNTNPWAVDRCCGKRRDPPITGGTEVRPTDEARKEEKKGEIRIERAIGASQGRQEYEKDGETK